MNRLNLFLILMGCAACTFSFAASGSLSATQTSTQSRASDFLQPCSIPNVDGEARCGKYEVYEDRAAKTGRRIDLNIVVLRALSQTPAADPVFWIHGGPGAAATLSIRDAKGSFLEGLRKDRDLVFVDQRGTGMSNPLNCDLGDDPSDLQTYYGDLFPQNLVRACRDKLEKSADLRLYTTPIAMDDLDEIRAALGYDKINLVAASYGTIAAQVYLRQHPDHVRAVFLLGVATPGVKQPLLFAKGAQHAMDLLFEDCDADDVCQKAFPKLHEEFDSLLARFKNGPVEVQLLKLADKQPVTIKLSRGNLVERLRLLLYTTTFARYVPFVIHSAYQNDYLPFEAVTTLYNPGSILARGMYMTVTCSEGVPFISEQDIVNETKGTFLGDYRVRSHQDACKQWPQGDVPQSFIDPVKSSVPVLMISGEVDASTPSWFGESAVKYLSHGRQVKIRYYGHQIDDPCIWDILGKFIGKGSTEGLDTSCTDKIRRPPFATELPQQFSLR